MTQPTTIAKIGDRIRYQADSPHSKGATVIHVTDRSAVVRFDDGDESAWRHGDYVFIEPAPAPEPVRKVTIHVASCDIQDETWGYRGEWEQNRVGSFDTPVTFLITGQSVELAAAAEARELREQVERLTRERDEARARAATWRVRCDGVIQQLATAEREREEARRELSTVKAGAVELDRRLATLEGVVREEVKQLRREAQRCRDGGSKGTAAVINASIERLNAAVEPVQPAKQKPTILETLDAIHAAGGSAWDNVADPDAAIREMRAEQQPAPAAKPDDAVRRVVEAAVKYREANAALGGGVEATSRCSDAWFALFAAVDALAGEGRE